MIFFAWLAIATVGVLIAHLLFGARLSISIWVAILVLLSSFVNGWLATWEDEQPGGFNNPEPGQTRRYFGTPGIRTVVMICTVLSLFVTLYCFFEYQMPKAQYTKV